LLEIYRKQFKRKTPDVDEPEGPGGRQVCAYTAGGKREYRSRTETMWQRQLGYCTICLKPMRIEEATYEHSEGRGMGGGHRDDRIEVKGVWQNAAVHGMCNVLKGSVRLERFKGAA
jgi:hypothetical protein